jgi:hypothetical protein
MRFFLLCGVQGATVLLLGQVSATRPDDVSVCELVRDPIRYDGKRVRVAASVNHEFENVTLDEGTCGLPENARSIWVRYEALRMHSVGSGYPAGSRGPATTFVQKLEAVRLRSPNSAGCSGRACYLYDVSGTLTGVFRAATGSFGDENSTGFGHMGCCHLLVVDGVESMTATRTATPAGGTFSCRTDTYTLPPDLAATWRAHVERSEFDGAHHETAIAATARAVDEPWQNVRGLWSYWLSDGRSSHATWISDDLQVTLTVRVEKESADGGGAVTVARERCQPIAPPLPADTEVTCRTFQYGSFIPGQEPSGAPSRSGAVGEAALLLLSALADQGLLPRLAAVPLHCSNVGDLPGFSFASCVGASPDGLQGVNAAFRRRTDDSLRTWVTSRATVALCETTGP